METTLAPSRRIGTALARWLDSSAGDSSVGDACNIDIVREPPALTASAIMRDSRNGEIK